MKFLEGNPAALGLDAVLGSLQDADDTQAGLAVAQRALPVLDALGKMRDHRLQRLPAVDPRRPDVARPITNQHAAPGFRIFADRDAPVVDLDLLVGCQVVVNESLAAAPDKKMADLRPD